MASPPIRPTPDSPSRPWVAHVQRSCAAITRYADRGVTVVCALIVLFLCASTFLGVIYRYVLEKPLAWPEEVARFLLVWLSLLAAARSLRRGQHIALEFAVVRLPGWARLALRQIVNIVVIVFVGIFVVEAAEYLEIVEPQRATATGISMLWPYLALSVSFSIMLLFAALDVVDWACSQVTGLSTSLAVAAVEERAALLNPGVEEPGVLVPDLHDPKEN